MRGRVWIGHVELDRRDWRVGIAWHTDPQGLHVYVCCVVRLHFLRTRAVEWAPLADKLMLPPLEPPAAAPKPPGKIQTTRRRWRALR